MSSNQRNLKSMLDASVTASKPDYRAISADSVEALMSAQSSGTVSIKRESVRGGGEKAGASSGIMLFDAELDGALQALVLRYAPLDNPLRIFADYAIAEQFALQDVLCSCGLPVPKPLFVDSNGKHLGLPGYIMEHIDGVVADGSPYTGGIIAEASPSRRRALIEEIFSALQKTHLVDWQATGALDFVRNEDGPTPIAGYINWFWKTAIWSAPADLGRLAKARDWLLANMPDYHRDDYRLVHGDPGLGNYMFGADGSVVAILDWELAGVAHPTYDVVMQCALNEFFRSAAPPEIAETIPSPEEWMRHYCEVTGETLVDLDYYRKLVAYSQAVVFLSMNRALPEGMRVGHASMLAPVWQVLES